MAWSPAAEGELSIVIAVRWPQDDVVRCLRSIAAQRDPNLRAIVVKRPGMSLAELRAEGLRQADGALVAIVDPSVRLGTGWALAVRHGLARHPAVTGPVRYAGHPSTATRAAFLVEYGGFLPPVRSGVAGTNVAFRRDVLPPVVATWWKDEVVGDLAGQGIIPAIVDGMVVHHRRRWSVWPFVVDRFQHGRCYAGRRPRRPLRWLLTPLVALVLFSRLAVSLATKSGDRIAFLRAAPLMLLYSFAWAAGEGIGYLAGPGSSCQAT